MEKRSHIEGRTWIESRSTYEDGLFYLSLFAFNQMEQTEADEIHELLDAAVTKYLKERNAK